jgi:hypothetical protein
VAMVALVALVALVAMAAAAVASPHVRGVEHFDDAICNILNRIVAAKVILKSSKGLKRRQSLQSPSQ